MLREIVNIILSIGALIIIGFICSFLMILNAIKVEFRRKK